MQHIYTQIYSTYNKKKRLFADRFMRTLNNKIYKYMSSISKNVYINKLDDAANENNNIYQNEVQSKWAIDVTFSTCFDFEIGSNDKHPTFQLILKSWWPHKNIKIKKTFWQKVTL